MTRPICIIVLLIFIFSLSGNLYASDTSHGKSAKHSEGKHSAADGHADTKGGFTFWYVIYWAGLLGLLGLSGKFLPEALNKGFTEVSVTDQDILLVLQLIMLGGFIYFIDQFDSMKHYHENALLGFVKFICKVGAGMAMVVYSFSGLSEQDHH